MSEANRAAMSEALRNYRSAKATGRTMMASAEDDDDDREDSRDETDGLGKEAEELMLQAQQPTASLKRKLRGES